MTREIYESALVSEINEAWTPAARAAAAAARKGRGTLSISDRKRAATLAYRKAGGIRNKTLAKVGNKYASDALTAASRLPDNRQSGELRKYDRALGKIGGWHISHRQRHPSSAAGVTRQSAAEGIRDFRRQHSTLVKGQKLKRRTRPNKYDHLG